MSKSLNYIKSLIIIGIVILQLSLYRSSNLILYVVLLLGFILNHQLRRLFIKNDLSYIISILLDIAILSFLVYSISLINSLLLIITLIDSIFTKHRISIGLICVTTTSFLALNIAFKDAYTFYNIVIYAIFIGLLVIIHNQYNQNDKLSHLYDDVRKYSYELEKAKSQIEQYTKEVSELSTIRERNRIAEELHDSIGHKLTSLLYRLQACEIAIQQDLRKGLNDLTGIIESLRENIVLLRNKVKNVEVKSYRNFKNSLVELVENCKRSMPFSIDLCFEGVQKKLSPDQETVLFNNTREALTNVAKHSKGNHVTIILKYESNTVLLLIEDNGLVNKQITKGYGLRTMATRTELINGTMCIETSNGFKLTFSIPI